MKRFAGKVDGIDNQGKLIIFNQAAYQTELNNLIGDRVDFSIVKHRDKASWDQHKYYRGMLKYACHFIPEKFNMNETKLHRHYKWEFREIEEIGGEMIPVMKSMKDMNTLEMTRFIERFRMDLRHPDNKWGICIDTCDPEEYWQMKKDGTWDY